MALRGSVARRYAKALLAIARENKTIDRTGAELRKVSDFFKAGPELFAKVLSPNLTIADRAQVIDKIVSAMKISQNTAAFLKLVSQKGRLEYLARIQEAYQALSDQASGLARARVFSAHAMPAALQKTLLAALEKRLSKKVQAEFAVMPELIGGVKVQVGGMLLDGSVQAQLRRMQEELKRI